MLFVLLQSVSTRRSGAVLFKLSCVYELDGELVTVQTPVQQIWGGQKSTFLTSSQVMPKLPVQEENFILVQYSREPSHPPLPPTSPPRPHPPSPHPPANFLFSEKYTLNNYVLGRMFPRLDKSSEGF